MVVSMVAPQLVALRPLGPPDLRERRRRRRRGLPAAARPAAAGDRRTARRCPTSSPSPTACASDRRSRTPRRASSSSASSRPRRRSGITAVVAAGDSGSSACARGVPAEPAHAADKRPQVVLAGELAVGPRRRRHEPDAGRRQRHRLDRRVERHRLPRALHRRRGRRRRLSTFEPAPVVAAGAVVRDLRQAHGPRRRRVRRREPGLRDRLLERRPGLPSGSGQSIAFVGGTSAATPLVAGMIALWTQQAQQPGPAAARLRRRRCSTARPAEPAGVRRHHAGHQRALRRLVLPGPARASTSRPAGARRWRTPVAALLG